MARELRLAQRRHPDEGIQPENEGALAVIGLGDTQNLSTCENRTVSRDGRIICNKIVEGDNEVSPNVCRDCPYRAVDCAHLRFSLHLEAASPLIVRYNGRTEVWDDGPPELRFDRAACAAKTMPIYDPRSCAGCVLRKSLGLRAASPRHVPQMAGNGKVVSFPSREALVAAG